MKEWRIRKESPTLRYSDRATNHDFLARYQRTLLYDPPKPHVLRRLIAKVLRP